MSKFYTNNSMVRIFGDESLMVTDDLPIRTYVLKFDREIGLFLEFADPIFAPDELYGDVSKDADLVIDTYGQIGRQMGILMTGPKGTGKTLTSKIIASKLKKDHPIIIIDNKFNTSMMSDFFSKITTAAVFIFDEFDKHYKDGFFGNDDDRPTQTGLLTLLDGVMSGSHLFIFIANDANRISQFMLNRPSRIRYHFRYNAISDITFEEYLDKRLLNKSFVNDIRNIKKVIPEFTFDILQILVEESNLYNSSPKDFIDCLNISPEETYISYNITIINKETGQTQVLKNQRLNLNSDDYYDRRIKIKVNDPVKNKQEYNNDSDDEPIAATTLSSSDIEVKNIRYYDNGHADVILDYQNLSTITTKGEYVYEIDKFVIKLVPNFTKKSYSSFLDF